MSGSDGIGRLRYPLFVIARDGDMLPLTLQRDDGRTVYPVFETYEEACRLAASLKVKHAVALKMNESQKMRNAISYAAQHCGATLVLLPRGLDPEANVDAPAHPIADVLQLIDEQLAAEKKAGLN